MVPEADIANWLLAGWDVRWPNPFPRATDLLGISYAARWIPSSIRGIISPLGLLSGPAWVRLRDILYRRPALDALGHRPGEGRWLYRVRMRRFIGKNLHPCIDNPGFPPSPESETSEDADDMIDTLVADRWARTKIRRFVRRIVRRHREAAQYRRLTQGLLRSLHPVIPGVATILRTLSQMLTPRSPALRGWPSDIPTHLRRPHHR